MRLVSDPRRLADHGLNATTELLSPHLRRDAVGMTLPIVFEDDEHAPVWLVRHQERGAIEASNLTDAQVVYHDPYMTLDSNTDSVEPSLAVAVEKLAMGATIEVDPQLPLARFDAIRARVNLQLSTPTTHHAGGLSSSRVIDHRDVENRFRTLLARLRPTARRLIAGSSGLGPLEPLLDQWDHDTRFADLEELLAQSGADGFIATSPINIEELTGQPAPKDAAALYACGTGQVHLLMPHDLSEEVRRCGLWSVLVEENDLTAAQASVLRAANVTLTYGSDAIAKWRERRDHQYLPALVIVTAASRHALDNAIAWSREQISNHIAVTEQDVQQRYLQIARRFAADIGLADTIVEFFSNCHSGRRTLHPCLAAPYALDTATTSLKLDAGLAVVVDGVTLATSDVARTYLGSDEATEVYTTFQHIVRQTIIDQLRPGVEFAELHHHVVDRIHDQRRILDSAGLWPNNIDLTHRYAMRNVGHLMGRQESFSSEFRVGDTERLQIGDYGACEIQWPLGNHAIGAEEMWILTPTGPILLTN